MKWRHASRVTTISIVPEFKLGTNSLKFQFDKSTAVLTYNPPCVIADYVCNFCDLGHPLYNQPKVDDIF